jgi:hypothetical protein
MLLYFVLLLSDGKHYKEIPLLTRLGLPHPGDEEFVTIRRDSPINVGKRISSRAEPGSETPTRQGNLDQRQFQPPTGVFAHKVTKPCGRRHYFREPRF